MFEVRGTFCFSFFDPRVPLCTTTARAGAFLSFLPPDLPSTSTILGATVTYQCDHLSAIRALEDSFDVCAIGIGQVEPEHVQVVFRVFGNAETCAFKWQHRVTRGGGVGGGLVENVLARL